MAGGLVLSEPFDFTQGESKDDRLMEKLLKKGAKAVGAKFALIGKSSEKGRG